MKGGARRVLPPWPYPRVLAHRGGGVLAPENTLAGLRAGYAAGFRGVEFDVMLAADGVPVLMHDPMLGRTVAGEGAVSSRTSQALQRMDAGSWHPSGRFAGEGVPTYAEAVAFCRAHDVWMNVEIKPSPGYEAITGEVVAAVTQSLFADALAAGEKRRHALPLFASFSFEALAAARDRAPAIPRGALFTVIPDNWQTVLVELDCVALHVNHRMLTPYLADQVRAAGYWLFCYTPNDAARVDELFSWGVDGICTDRLDAVATQ